MGRIGVTASAAVPAAHAPPPAREEGHHELLVQAPDAVAGDDALFVPDRNPPPLANSTQPLLRCANSPCYGVILS